MMYSPYKKTYREMESLESESEAEEIADGEKSIGGSHRSMEILKMMDSKQKQKQKSFLKRINTHRWDENLVLLDHNWLLNIEEQARSFRVNRGTVSRRVRYEGERAVGGFVRVFEA